ncbi:MAG: cell division protein FtsW [Alphaproteobacteria bacterium]|jgi:cell division protein FtsW|nr:cell division protein FtsW [Alphaproteobacteria bacterium]
MIALSRTDTSVVGRWWWTVDRWLLAAIIGVVMFGAMLTMAASPPVADRLGIDSYHFAQRQLFFFLPAALGLTIFISVLTPQQVRRFAMLAFLGSLALLALTLVAGAEIKGSRRWLSLGLLSIQPSEFVKPTFAVVAAWLFTRKKLDRRFPGNLAAVALFGVVMALLLLQPDLGMAVVVAAVFFAQFFLAGLPIYLVVGGVLLGAGGLIGAYTMLSHVRSRIDRFLDPSTGDSYQVSTALEAFLNGGLLGRGPGEGTVKASLPDAHTDFVLAVAGEEFGLIVCLIIVGLYAFIVLRGMSRALQETSLFLMLAASGLLVQFGLQALINMGSTVQLMPTKGMTLPFISYGGSSALATALSIGMLLALTRRRGSIGEIE